MMQFNGMLKTKKIDISGDILMSINQMRLGRKFLS
jgi:hypothetical protein